MPHESWLKKSFPLPSNTKNSRFDATDAMRHDTDNMVITRIAPSPTGQFHIGTARTALFNYLYAKRHGGSFIVRIEDTDQARSKKEYEDNILEGMRWLGLSWETFARQSERTELYVEMIDKAITSGKAFVSKEESKAEPGKKVEVVRLRNPNKSITFSDEIRGEITFDTTELGDFVIARSISEPLYHFAVVVDDAQMGITHVIRGEDHISNTPRQILIQEALGYSRPVYGHLPLILAPDRTKLSKRHGAVSVSEYEALGYLPEAIVNYLALLGWNPGTDEEVFTLDELLKRFDLSGVQKGGAIFNIEKLDWFNRQHIRRADAVRLDAALSAALAAFPRLIEVFLTSTAAREDLLERIATFGEARRLAEQGEYAYYELAPEYVDPKHLLWKKAPDADRTIERLAQVAKILENIEESAFCRQSISSAIDPYAEIEGKGAVLWPLRFSLAGRDRSPDPYTIAEAIGKQETLTRIANAILALQKLCKDSHHAELE
jgi:glutamyl-tRNA synthetase